jgi:hypothetical protein
MLKASENIVALHLPHYLGNDSGMRINPLLSASNAALEWQAGRLGWRSWDLMVACPLEGLVRRRNLQLT